MKVSPLMWWLSAASGMFIGIVFVTQTAVNVGIGRVLGNPIRATWLNFNIAFLILLPLGLYFGVFCSFVLCSFCVLFVCVVLCVVCVALLCCCVVLCGCVAVMLLCCVFSCGVVVFVLCGYVLWLCG